MNKTTRWQSLVIWLGAMLTSFVMLGCYESAEDQVRDQASNYLNCPENAIDVAYVAAYQTSGGIYRAVGCGKSATYLCRGDRKAFDTEFSCCNAATCSSPPPE